MTNPWPADVDRIAIAGIKARGFHGVLDFEKTEGQDFIVDVVLAVDTRAAAAADDLAATVDYSVVAADVVALIEDEPMNLIETLAQRIADVVLNQWLVRGVIVTVHKPEAPMNVEFADVSITIERWRP